MIDPAQFQMLIHCNSHRPVANEMTMYRTEIAASGFRIPTTEHITDSRHAGTCTGTPHLFIQRKFNGNEK